MIQYKLIKEYPGSPKLGTIDWYKNDDGFNKSSSNWQGTNFYDAHTEFWQKVEELDYLITEVKYSGQIRKLKQGEYRILDFGIGFKLDYILKDGGTIFSVKRLSDGEVFTIGDVFNYDHYSNTNNITEIYITKDESVKQGVWLKYAGGCCHLHLAKKLPNKTPLFTTEDGVDIFDKKTSFYLVSNDFKICFCQWFSPADYPFKTFSTKEKAEEYILLSKPCLSFIDVVKDLRDLVSVHKIKELAKSKL